MSSNEPQNSRALFAGLVCNAVIVGAAILYVGHQNRGSDPVSAAFPAAASQHAQAGVSPLLKSDGDTTGVLVGELDLTYAETDYVYGPKLAPVSVFSYVDLQCAYCAKFDPTITRLVDESGGGINLVTRIYPLQLGSVSEHLALAAHCVGDSGGGAAFHGFVTQALARGRVGESAAKDLVSGIAEKLGVDASKVAGCVEDKKFSDRINAAIDEAVSAGIAGTPTSVIYNHTTKKAKVIAGTRSIDQLKADIATL